jgi:hypothetical protein
MKKRSSQGMREVTACWVEREASEAKNKSKKKSKKLTSNNEGRKKKKEKKNNQRGLGSGRQATPYPK